MTSDRPDSEAPPPYGPARPGEGASASRAPQQAYEQDQHGAQRPRGQQRPAAGGRTPAPRRTLSLISMISGIAGLAGIPIVPWAVAPFPIAAVILGHLAQARGGSGAKPLWLTGLITGYIGAGIIMLYLAFLLLIFGIFGGLFGVLGIIEWIASQRF